MKTKEYLVQIDDSLYEINFAKLSRVTSASISCSSLDPKWTSLALSKNPCIVAADDGNGVLLSFDQKKTIYLNYSEIVELRALLHMFEEAEVSISNLTKKVKLKKWVQSK